MTKNPSQNSDPQDHAASHDEPIEPTVFQPDPMTAPSTGSAPGSPYAGTENAPQGPTANSPFGPANQPEDPLKSLPQSLKDRYQLTTVLGKGGFANVYRARDTVLEQDVAIKILKLGLTSKSDQDRFLFEARVSAKLRHPNIVTVFDIIRTPDGLQLIMEYYPNGTLSELIKKKGALRPRMAIDYSCQILKGLAHAHRRDIIHRDIKPANIFLAEEGMIKLGDFGIAANVMNHEHTQTGMIIGTPLYMAPEQAQDSRDVDPRTDIYAMGLMLYHMLTGHPPRVLNLDLIPEPFRPVVRQSTEPDRMKRIVSASQFIAMLEQVDAELSGATPVPYSSSPGRSAREEPTLNPANSRFDHNEFDYEEESMVGETYVPMPETTHPPASTGTDSTDSRVASTTATGGSAPRTPPRPQTLPPETGDSTVTENPVTPAASPADGPVITSFETSPQETPARRTGSRLIPAIVVLCLVGAVGVIGFLINGSGSSSNANGTLSEVATGTPAATQSPEPTASPTPQPTQSPLPTASPTPQPSATTTPTPPPNPRDQIQAHIAELKQNVLIQNLTRQIEIYYTPGSDDTSRTVASSGLRNYLAQINASNPTDPFVQLILAYGNVALGESGEAQKRIQYVLTNARQQSRPLPLRPAQIHNLLGFSGNVPMLEIPLPEQPLTRPQNRRPGPGFGGN